MADEIHFDGWTLVRPSGELVRGSTRVRLQGQPQHVLEALLATPGEIVTREHLIAQLWPNGVVVDFDTALNSAVRRLRTALDDHAESPRYIETIPRRGYRFIGRLDTTFEVGSRATIAVAAGSKYAPFDPVVPMSAERSDEGVRALRSRMRSWRSVGIVVVVAASIGLFGLLPFRSGSTALESESTKQPMVSGSAREQYERARFFYDRRGNGDTARAIELFEKALSSEPGYAAAWAGLASARWIDTVEGRSERQGGLARTRDAAERALEFDPANVEAHLRLANYELAMGNRIAARTHMNRAVELDPEDALVLSFQAGEAASAGRFDEAIALQRRSVQRGPLTIASRTNLGVWLYLAGHFDEARAEFARSSALSPPRERPEAIIGQSLLLTGDHSGALAFAATLPSDIHRYQLEALAYFALGRRAEADLALQQLKERAPARLAYLVAEVHAYRGEPDAAFEWLNRAVRADDSICKTMDCWPLKWLAALPLLRPLHADPRWQGLKSTLGSDAVLAQAR